MSSASLLDTPTMMTPSNDTLLRVRALLADVLNVDAPANDTDLVDTGVLDSLALVSLILELENAFDITVSYDDLEIDAFRTVNSIGAFVSASAN